MRRQRFRGLPLATAVLAAVAALPVPGNAQGVEAPGVRARGMGGAFVAVADDASAGWWNPAGLATIRLFDASLDIGLADFRPQGELAVDDDGAGRWRQGGVFVALPVLGFSVNRMITQRVGAFATAEVNAGRQEEGSVISARVLRTTHVGVSLVQSLTDALVVGGTVRFVRGRAEVLLLPPDTDLDDAFDRADEVDGRTGTRLDADLGVVAALGVVRVALAARNLAEAAFDGPTGERLGLERQVRVGVAVGDEPAYRQRAWQVAADADLLAYEGPDGSRRGLAAGAERWWANRRFAVRGGVQAQTVGALRPAASAGGSVAVWSGLLIEAQATGGGDRVARGWGVAARVAF